MPREKSIASNGAYKSNTIFNVKEFNKVITKGYLESGKKSGKTKKTTFSPSTVGYGHGRCPRYWFGAFTGANFEYQDDPTSIANMENGTMSHERIQKALRLAGIVESTEKELKIADPPIRGFCDVIVNWEDEKLVGEIKTTSQESFALRRSSMQIPGYHMVQILLYMHGSEIDKGFLMYENKNTHRILVIPIEMNEKNREFLDYVLNWMRDVRKNWEDNLLPNRPFEEDSKECSGCPIKRGCWAGHEGVIELPSLNVPK